MTFVSWMGVGLLVALFIFYVTFPEARRGTGLYATVFLVISSAGVVLVGKTVANDNTELVTVFTGLSCWTLFSIAIIYYVETSARPRREAEKRRRAELARLQATRMRPTAATKDGDATSNTTPPGAEDKKAGSPKVD